MSEFDLEGILTLFYYDDLERAFNFYNDARALGVNSL